MKKAKQYLMQMISFLLILLAAFSCGYIVFTPQTAEAESIPYIKVPATVEQNQILSPLSYTLSTTSTSAPAPIETEEVLTPTSPLNETEEQQILTAIYTLSAQEDHSIAINQYTVEDIYYSDESWAGYIIEFITAQENGYAIFFYIENSYHLIELRFGTFSPYFGKEGMYIYPAIDSYIVKIEEQYYDAETLLPFAFTATDEPIFYAARSPIYGDHFTPHTRTIPFAKSGLYEYTIPDFYDNYSTSLTSASHPNNCANAAGVIMLNYWNKKSNNKLLNLTTTQLTSNDNMTSTAAIEYMNIFYEYMNTNWILGSGGTLPTNCYNGFQRLIEEKGAIIDIVKEISYEEMMSQLKSGRPLFITSVDYYLTDDTTKENVSSLPIPTDGTSLTIDYIHSSGYAYGHTVVGYGYAYYQLQLADGTVQREQFIKVADGWGDSRYFNYTISTVYSSAAVFVNTRFL